MSSWKHKLFTAECSTDAIEKKNLPYDKVVSSLYYLILCRIDIALAMKKIMSYILNLMKVHWEEIKLIIRYVKSTKYFDLLFDYL